MPDGGIQQQYLYRPAARGKTAPLIMIAGPPGTGKTFSALRLARGMAGPDGKIFLADTDNGRSLFYADSFIFSHLGLHDPFRPVIFEEAARQAQQQGADVLIIDNFMHEHAGPGGLLEWHTEINARMARGNAARLESTKMVAWIEPKAHHKRMRERLYQLNIPIILCCGAERKMSMVKQTEGEHRGKVIPIDIGLQPICGTDIPWAMTVSLMLPDVHAPGVPVPIKALLPALRPIIRFDKPLDEATGAAIAAWSRGEKRPATGPATGHKVGEDSQSKSGKGEPAAPAGQNPPSNPPASAPPGDDVPRAGPSGAGEGPPGAPPEGNPPEDPPPPEGAEPPPDGVPPEDVPPAADATPGDGAPPEGPPPEDPDPEDETEARITRKAAEIVELFNGTQTRADHLKLVDDKETRGSFEWIKKHRRPVYLDVIEPALKASWKRTDPKTVATQQGA
jgi:hypothetical protein